MLVTLLAYWVGFSRESEPVGYLCVFQEEAQCDQLACAVIEAQRSRPRRASGVNASQRKVDIPARRQAEEENASYSAFH